MPDRALHSALSITLTPANTTRIPAITPVIKRLPHYQENYFGGRRALLERRHIIDVPALNHTGLMVDPKMACHPNRPTRCNIEEHVDQWVTAEAGALKEGLAIFFGTDPLGL